MHMPSENMLIKMKFYCWFVAPASSVIFIIRKISFQFLIFNQWHHEIWLNTSVAVFVNLHRSSNAFSVSPNTHTHTEFFEWICRCCLPTHSLDACVCEYISNRINYFSPTLIWNCCFFLFLMWFLLSSSQRDGFVVCARGAFFLSYLSRWCQIVIIVYFSTEIVLFDDMCVCLCCCYPKCVRCSQFGDAHNAIEKCSIWKAADIFYLVVIADKRTGVLCVCVFGADVWAGFCFFLCVNCLLVDMPARKCANEWERVHRFTVFCTAFCWTFCFLLFFCFFHPLFS